ncbi:MFS transporter [Evansella tamaricis]|uniref:MFS transporter n=1 Tax=Evansella tamaricis TaxID=2069301 RepID=A0ABS6JLD5_9BACI|nr:MFS transporter [Evansella tamaricis]MBU9714363.1 MFS transporter [Evansella tamaricis]
MSEVTVALDKRVQKVPKTPSVFKEYRFVLLFLTLLVSSFSVSFFSLATNWYVVNFLGLEAMLGIVMFASSVPRLVFMLIGGVIADRVSKAWVMFISDFTKGVLLVGIIALLMFDLLAIWPLIVLAFIFGLLDAFFWPASSAILPETVKEEQLTRANSVLNMTRQASMIVGPLLAGIMLAIGGYVLIFGITAATLLIAGIIDLMMKRNMPKEERDSKQSKLGLNGGGMFASIKEGFLYVKNSSFLLALMLSAVFLNLLFSGPFMLGLPIFATHVLEGTEVTYSFLSGGIAGGMVLGSILVGVLNIKKKRGVFSIAGILALAIFCLAFSLSSSFYLNMAFVILIGAASSVANIPLLAVIQHHTEKEYLGRVMSFISFSAMGLMPISFLFTTLLLALSISIDVIMLVSASALIMVSTMIIWKGKGLRMVD